MFKVIVAIACSTTTLFCCSSNAIARNPALTKKHASPVFGLNNINDTTPFPNTPIGLAKVGGPTGKITGKLLNVKTGDPIVGASITLKSGPITRTVKSDYNGVYTVSELPEGTYSLSITHITFGNKLIEDVKIIKKDVVTQDITMQESKGKNLDEVVVTSKGSGRIKESVAALLIQQKNAASVSDGISAEAIKRTPDKNTSDIMKRVSGASIQEDRFVVIRGMNDRYNASFINNCPLPSSESDRKAFSFDVFPANMLDNLVIVKTATPDMNADFAGGTIYINTKDIPTKSFQSISFGLGYNTLATFKERKFENRGKWDWIGLDDGTRKLPSNIPSTSLRDLSKIEQGELGKSLPNNWALNTGSTPLNYNFQYAKGINIQRHQKDFLGILLSATYNRTNNLQDGEKYSFSGTNSTSSYNSKYSTKTYTNQVLAGLMGNISLKINNNNKISFKNLLSINTESRIINRFGDPEPINDSTPSTITVTSKALWFTSNKIVSSQLNGEHFWTLPKIKINWNGGYTSVDRQIPSLRTLGTYSNTDLPDLGTIQSINEIYSVGTLGASGCIFTSSTKENIKNFGTDFLRMFRINNDNSIQVKAGVYFQGRNRDFNARYLSIIKLDSFPYRHDDSLMRQSDDSVFASQNFGVQKNGKFGFGLSEDYKPRNSYTASSDLSAYYLMLDARLFKFLRINGGLRVEKFNQFLTSGDTSLKQINTSLTDNLPSANLIVSLNSKQNLRFSYSQTINRPEYRELAPFIFYDNVTQLSIEGKDTLKRVKINNFDFRYEFYPSGGQLLSFSLFQKNIPNPIEFVINDNSNATYINANNGKIQGIELETRTNLGSLFKSRPNSFLSNTTIFGNLSIIKSEVSFDKDSIMFKKYGETRRMQGQSPYIYNAGITYQDQKGYAGTLQVNYSAPRIFIGGNTGVPAILENGRAVVDFQLAKTFRKNNIELKLNVKDVLAKEFLRFYDLDNNGKYDADTDKKFISFTNGRVISASVTYKF